MRELPVLFSGDLVRAILDGRKTTTRLPVKPAIPEGWWFAGWAGPFGGPRDEPWSALFPGPTGSYCGVSRDCPWMPGDLLYVRETWCVEPVGPGPGMGHWGVRYRADSVLRDDIPDLELPRPIRDRMTLWRPSTNMPKWAARIWLRVTEVRVERVQDITEDGARAGGVAPYRKGCDHIRHSCEDVGCTEQVHREGFRRVWNHIYGDWDANPWVWVVDFELPSTTGRPGGQP